MMRLSSTGDCVLTVQIDRLSVYALSDSSHELEKDSWRNFLGVIAPLLLECPTESVALWIEDTAHCNSDELFSVAGTVLASAHALTRSDEETFKLSPGNIHIQDNALLPAFLLILFSGEISHDLGLTREFGIAAFVEPTLATKVHQLSSKKFGRLVASKSRSQAKLIGKWLERFSKFQHEEDFLKSILFWKELLEPLWQNELEENSSDSEGILDVEEFKNPAISKAG
jgi:hypothetical protein